LRERAVGAGAPPSLGVRQSLTQIEHDSIRSLLKPFRRSQPIERKGRQHGPLLFVRRLSDGAEQIGAQLGEKVIEPLPKRELGMEAAVVEVVDQRLQRPGGQALPLMLPGQLHPPAFDLFSRDPGRILGRVRGVAPSTGLPDTLSA